MVPNEYSQEEWQAEWDKLSNEEKHERTKLVTLAKFAEALTSGDLIGATARLGVLKVLGIEDFPYYEGMILLKSDKYDEAAEAFKKITVDSEKYQYARMGLIRIYVDKGDYLSLHKLFSEDGPEKAIEKYENRLLCLLRIAPEVFQETVAKFEKDTFETVESINPSNEEESHVVFRIFALFGNMLSAAGECINRCGTYQEDVGKTIADIENNPDLQTHVRAYNKAVYILEQSRFFKPLIFSDDRVDSLAVCALKNKSWQEKIFELRNTDYDKRLAGVMIGLMHPDRHKYEDKYVVIRTLMEQLASINPHYTQSLLNEFGDTVIEAANNGDDSAIMYLGLALGDILAEGKDKYNLRDKIENCLNNLSDHTWEKVIRERELIALMTHAGYEALQNAERVFSHSKNVIGPKDASSIALQYFRVLEIEYNAKLIKPLLNILDINALKASLQSQRESNKKIWEKELDMLDRLKSGDKTASLGDIRVLLDKARTPSGSISSELSTKIRSLLTRDGVRAFLNGPMLALINQGNLDRYRVPGAHQGFVPFSEAAQARELVINNIPKIEKWFTN